MLSNGQLVFAILFAVVFVIVIIYTYRKDLKLHQKYYKGSLWILVAFIAFVLLITAAKSLLT